MAKNYKMIRIPKDVWEDWYQRKNRIEERVNIATNKKNRITLTNVLRFYGKRKAYIFDDEVMNFFKNTKRRRKQEVTLL
jgi:hypothetical protein